MHTFCLQNCSFRKTWRFVPRCQRSCRQKGGQFWTPTWPVAVTCGHSLSSRQQTVLHVVSNPHGRLAYLLLQVLAELPAPGWAVSDADLAGRRDLRAERIFSIDPPTARDLDDALSVQRLPDGNFRVGVHIADVSHFVRCRASPWAISVTCAIWSIFLPA